jgi:beta-glucanase (GH16 family)
MLAAGALLAPVVVASLPSAASTSKGATQAHTRYPLGVVSPHEPSGMAPPTAGSLPGYSLVYTQDFSKARFPSEWGKFDGPAGGNPGSMFVPSHVRTAGGVARIVAQRDKVNGGNWATGGMCLCSHPQLYGAFFVRSRVTGPGPNVSELLWPVAHVWPPEVDFNEMGFPTNSTSWTVHYGHGYTFVQQTRSWNMLRWHTWGVIWTPRRLTFTIDGHSWGTLTRLTQIPHQRMTLDIQSETWCQGGAGAGACPLRPSALQVDWVAIYKPA